VQVEALSRRERQIMDVRNARGSATQAAAALIGSETLSKDDVTRLTAMLERAHKGARE
jgi:hypothetical protein